ncbi:MAG: hypothetical protein Q8N14_00650 [Candidatus Omnitrophota bacterium]|nr:hypothetical protein [Candidatus Omnitrophota bacterium]
MKKIMFLALGISFMLISFGFSGSIIFAQEASSEAALQSSHQFIGVVTSFSDAELIVNNEENSYKFKIYAETKINGEIAVGKKVSVTFAYLKIFKSYLIKKALVINVLEEKKK